MESVGFKNSDYVTSLFFPTLGSILLCLYSVNITLYFAAKIHLYYKHAWEHLVSNESFLLGFQVLIECIQRDVSLSVTCLHSPKTAKRIEVLCGVEASVSGGGPHSPTGRGFDAAFAKLLWPLATSLGRY